MVFTFTLNYELTSDESGMDALVERLAEEGCDDALVGVGQPGRGLVGVGRSEGEFCAGTLQFLAEGLILASLRATDSPCD